MNIIALLKIAVAFATTALVSFGGILVMVPEIHRQAVEVFHWVSDAEFGTAFAVSQIAPGPNIMLMSLVGWRAFGIAGLLVATVSVVAPPGVLALVMGRMDAKFSSGKYLQMARTGLPPIVIGLMIASGVITAKLAVEGAVGFIIVTGVAIFVAFSKRNPLIPIILSIVVGVMAGRLGLIP